jgi:hypothetical protein
MRGSAAFRTGIAPGGALAGPWARNLLWSNARAVPSLDLDFAGTKSLKDNVSDQNLITFTRASSATYVDSTGTIRSAVTNLLLRSEEFDTSWARFGTTTLTTNTVIAPNGTLTADNIVFTSASAGIYQAPVGLPSTTYTFSIWIKSSSSTQVKIVINTNLSDPAFQTVAVTSNWQRFNITKTTSVGTTSVTAQLQDNGSGGTQFDLWGAQLEQSSTVGEYIPTTSTINSAPRFDHNPTTGESLGLLVEEARTNLLLRSEAIATSPWFPGANTTLTNNTGEVLDPAGGSTATKVLVSGGTGAFGQGATLTAAIHTGSIWLRCSTGTISASLIVYLSGSPFTNIGTANVTITTFWQRFTVVTSTATATAYNLQLNAIAVGTVYAWGAQLEAGASPTSYIPTTTATVTRAADVASITGSNFSSWYRQDEGTLLSSAASNTQNTSSIYWDFADGTINNRMVPYTSTPTTSSVFYASGGVGFSLGPGTIVYGSRNSLAFGYQLNNFAATLNGGIPVVNSSSAVAVGINKVNIGANLFSTASINGTIRRLVYWGQRLPNNVLQTITQ